MLDEGDRPAASHRAGPIIVIQVGQIVLVAKFVAVGANVFCFCHATGRVNTYAVPVIIGTVVGQIRNELTGNVIVDWRNIPNFDVIPELDNIPLYVKEGQALIVAQYLEKCKNYAGKCRNCPNSMNQQYCLLKMFSKMTGGHVHPHTAKEFGDIDFFAQFPSSKEQIIVIIKSNTKPTKKTSQDIFGTPYGLLTVKDDDRLFTQFYQLANLQSTRYIMIVSGKFLHAELEHYLIDVATIKKKSVIFLGPIELLQISSHISLQKQ